MVVNGQLDGQTLRWLGTTGGDFSGASGVSADGAVVACWAYDTNGRQRACRWTPTTGMADLGIPTSENYPLAISADGRTIVGWMGTAESPVAFRWNAAQGASAIGQGQGEAYGVSTYGDTVVGWTMNGTLAQGFYVRHSGRLRFIPNEFGGLYSRALGVSGDGEQVIALAQNNPQIAFVWNQATGQSIPLQGIPDMSTYSIGYGISADGDTVVGAVDVYKTDSDGNIVYDDWGNPIVITAASFWIAPYENAFVGVLGVLPGGDYSEAYATSGDGSVIVGIATDRVGHYRAFRWTASTGMQDLNTAYAHLLNGSVLEYAMAVSIDGRYIVGGGYNAQTRRGEAFLLDTWRQGDTDGNGCVNDADLLRVLFSFGSSGTGLTRYEDINDDGIVDDADLLLVLFNFGAGC